MREERFLVLKVGGALLVLMFFAWAIYQNFLWERRCTDNRGHWVKFNCRDNSTLRCTTDRSGKPECLMDYDEVCDQKCISATPEANE